MATTERVARVESNGVPAVKSNKPKSTPTLSGLGLFGTNPEKAKKETEAVAAVVTNEVVTMEALKIVWDEFAATRKNQVAEYQILKREFRFEHPIIMVTLTNAVEEPLLDNFKRDFIQFLRDKLKNSSLDIATSLQETVAGKKLYTDREKFEHLAEKNPHLRSLKERFGLDWEGA